MSAMKRVKVVINGKHSQVIDAETGKPIHFISVKAEMDFRKSDMGSCVIETYGPQVEYEGMGRIYTLCPACKKEREDLRDATNEAKR